MIDQKTSQSNLVQPRSTIHKIFFTIILSINLILFLLCQLNIGGKVIYRFFLSGNEVYSPEDMELSFVESIQKFLQSGL